MQTQTQSKLKSSKTPRKAKVAATTERPAAKKRQPAKLIRKMAPTPMANPLILKNFESLLNWYANSSANNVSEIHQHYRKDVFFKDPFTEVYGTDELEVYYTKIFASLRDMRFVIDNRALDGHQAFASWVMTATAMGQDLVVRGVSHFKFDSNSGLCEYHRDYFDLSEEIYERMPILGPVFKGIKRLML